MVSFDAHLFGPFAITVKFICVIWPIFSFKVIKDNTESTFLSIGLSSEMLFTLLSLQEEAINTTARNRTNNLFCFIYILLKNSYVIYNHSLWEYCGSIWTTWPIPTNCNIKNKKEIIVKCS